VGPKANTAEVLLSRASPEPNTGCWLWTGGERGKGYGAFPLGGRVIGAHRAAWLLLWRDPRGALTTAAVSGEGWRVVPVVVRRVE
jgi:hypothetical protein